MCVERTRSLSPPPGGLSVLTPFKDICLCLCSLYISIVGIEGQSDKRESHPASSSPVEVAGSPSGGPGLCRVPDGNRLPTGTPPAGVPDGPLPGEDLWKGFVQEGIKFRAPPSSVCY